ncbi:MAG: hypothetical protein WEB00_04625 [Dehalococcoidia bacterium]
MKTETTEIPARLEVRLDDERRRKLKDLTEDGGSLSDITRHGIDLAYEELVQKRRMEAAWRLSHLEVEDPPEPEEMNRQLNDRYGPLP